MLVFRGLVYVKHGRVGSRSEGPDYYLQTATCDYLLQHQVRMLWEPDYVLEFYQRKMVEISGLLQAPHLIEVKGITEVLLARLPTERTGQQPVLGESVQLKLNSSAAFENGPLLTFLSVIEDSRCPVGGTCIWEGRAVVRLRVEQTNGAAEELSLTLQAGHPALAETRSNGFKIVLHDLEPASPPPPEEPQTNYIATFAVSASHPIAR